MEKYSVLMAIYFKEKPEYLRSAVESMLVQTVPPEEFVLVCDGPLTQQLDGVIEGFCLRYPKLFRTVRMEKNLGLGAALNVGLQHCTNELVARMDSDDLAVPDRMEKQLAAMAHWPEISALGGQIGEFCGDPHRIHSYRMVPTGEREIREFLKRRSPMNHTTVVLRKSHIMQAGSYQPIPGFEDYTLWIRLTANGYRMRNIEDVCCRVRADGGMYARRGGLRYFQNTLKMERQLLETGLISPWQYWQNVAVRFLGTVILPARVRRLLFLNFLRSRNAKPQAALQQRIRFPKAGIVLPRQQIAGNTYIDQ